MFELMEQAWAESSKRGERILYVARAPRVKDREWSFDDVPELRTDHEEAYTKLA